MEADGENIAKQRKAGSPAARSMTVKAASDARLDRVGLKQKPVLGRL